MSQLVNKPFNICDTEVHTLLNKYEFTMIWWFNPADIDILWLNMSKSSGNNCWMLTLLETVTCGWFEWPPHRHNPRPLTAQNIQNDPITLWISLSTHIIPRDGLTSSCWSYHILCAGHDSVARRLVWRLFGMKVKDICLKDFWVE